MDIQDTTALIMITFWSLFGLGMIVVNAWTRRKLS